MKLHRFGAMTAMLAGFAFVGCSSDQGSEPGSKDASLSFNLVTTEGVEILTVSYDLNTQATPPADVVAGEIPVPNPDSEVTLGIQSLAAGSYSLSFAATGMYNGASVPCVSDPVLFSLASGQNLTLPTITLTCTVNGGVVDNTGSVAANVQVVVEQIAVNNIVETFTYAPREVNGRSVGGACTYPPIALRVANTNPSISYAWSLGTGTDGSFTGTAVNGTYQCASGGTKTLTLTATQGSTTFAKSIQVVCDAAACGITCGDGVVQGSEQCDIVPAVPRCQNCQIVPTCGDNVVDAPEQCDAPSLPTATCSINCTTITPAACGNGVLESGEACDNGAANSDTTPNACRTDCELAACGDNVVDTGEQCDAGPTGSATCSATCTTIAQGTLWDACETCILANPDLGPYHQASCLDAYPGSPGSCEGLQACIINSGCGSPVPAACYCGPDTSAACEADAFVPTGPCVSQIRGIVGASLTNAQVLVAAVDQGNASGQAFLIVSEAANVCQSACFAP